MKKLTIFLVSALLALFVGQTLVYAQTTILPKAEEKDCGKLLDHFERGSGFQTSNDGVTTDYTVADTLGCAVVTGRVSLSMIPYFIKYFSNYLLGIVSIIALLFVVIGGFLYTLGGLSQQKEKGKTFIMNAIIGMVIAFLAWTIVNVIISAITG